MIRNIKQIIKNFLIQKHDACYYQELEQQATSYHAWIQEREKEQEENSEIVTSDDFYNIKEFDFVILATEPERVFGKAIREIARVFEKDTEVELIYTDEDELNHNENVRMNPWFKPDYSPDTLLSYFYFGGLVAIRKSVFEEALAELEKKIKNHTFSLDQKEKNIYLNEIEIQKQFLEKQTGKQSLVLKMGAKKFLYALVLQVCSTLERRQVCHIKEVLYSSHTIKYWGFEEQYQDIRSYYDGLREREETSGVSVIIPSKDNPKVLERCLKSIQHWSNQDTYEIIVVDNGSTKENKRELEQLQAQYEFQYVYKPQEFNFSRMCNLGSSYAKYELLLFLNDDCEVRGSKWLSHMSSLARVKATGAVGAKLYYPESKRLQHCGIYNIQVGPVHKLQFKEDIRPYYDRRNLGVRNVLAVTAACLMIRKSVFEKIKGFDEELKVAFNDVDFCYSLYEAGYNNVVDNEIHLWHYESLSRGSDESPEKLNRLMCEKQKLYQKHSDLWEQDPYYHPGFSTDILDTGYSFDYEYPHHMHLAVEHPVSITQLPPGIREDACVAPMLEYAGDLKGWFLDQELVEKIEAVMQTKKAAYIQGNAVVLGSDNACFEKKIVLRSVTTGELYEITPEWIYRPDIFCNLSDQKNVALSGFAFLVNMEQMPVARYEIGIMVKDKISGQHLLRVTTRSIEKR